MIYAPDTTDLIDIALRLIRGTSKVDKERKFLLYAQGFEGVFSYEILSVSADNIVRDLSFNDDIMDLVVDFWERCSIENNEWYQMEIFFDDNDRTSNFRMRSEIEANVDLFQDRRPPLLSKYFGSASCEINGVALDRSTGFRLGK